MGVMEGEKERGGETRLRGEEEGEGGRAGMAAREGTGEGVTRIAFAEERRLGEEIKAGLGEPVRVPKRADGILGREGTGERMLG